MKSCKAISAIVVLAFMTLLFGLPGCVAANEPQVEESIVLEEQAPAEGDTAVVGAVEQTPVESSGEDASDQNSPAKLLEDYTWDELSQISAEIASAGDEAAGIEVAKKYNLCTADGKLDGTQVKSVTLSDGTQATVQIIGFNHDDKTAGGKAGISFIFGSAVTEMAMNPSDVNAGGWEASQLRAYLNSDGMFLLPQELAAKIVAVDKLTNNVGQTESVSSVSTTSDQLWLPSATELCGTIGWFGDRHSYDGIFNAEGSEYLLYRNMAVVSTTSNDILVKTYNGEACYWWGRSPFPDSPGSFLRVDSLGHPSAIALGGATNSFGVAPGFCI